MQRIIAAAAEGGKWRVVFGAKEPGTFVKDSQSCRLLSEAGTEWEYLEDFEDEILKVAMEGHVSKDTVEQGASGAEDQHDAGKKVSETEGREGVRDSSEVEKQGQEQKAAEAGPRNPKKRMMETI